MARILCGGTLKRDRATDGTPLPVLFHGEGLDSVTPSFRVETGAVDESDRRRFEPVFPNRLAADQGGVSQRNWKEVTPRPIVSDDVGTAIIKASREPDAAIGTTVTFVLLCAAGRVCMVVARMCR